MTSERETWTPAELHAFRVAFPAVVISMLLVTAMLQNYVPGALAKSLADPVLVAPGRNIRPLVVEAGAFIRRGITGDNVTWADPARRSTLDAATIATCLLLGIVGVSAIAAVVWGSIDRRRSHYRGLNRWLRTFARWVMSLVMLYYGLVKVVPTQFGFLTPGEMLRPFGELTPFWVLWNFMAVSPGYTVFTGLVEAAGAVLLLFHRTSVVGAVLLGAATTNVLAMNLAYDIRGAIMAAVCLSILSLFLMAPNLKPLFEFFVLRRATRLPSEQRLQPFGWKYSGAAKFAIIAVLAAIRIDDGLSQRKTYFESSHPVYGMFEVETFVRGGETIIPLSTDGTTWRRVASDGRYDGASLSVQFADGNVRRLRLTDDPAQRLWRLTENERTYATLQYELRSDQTVQMTGHIDGEPVALRLRRVDEAEFPLLRR